MQNAGTPTVLEVIPVEKLTPVWYKSTTIVRYETHKHDFPIFIDGVMFTKYVPGFEGFYATNVNGDLATLERTIFKEYVGHGPRTQTRKAKVCKQKREGTYNFSNEGVSLQLTRKGLVFYSGFKKPTFDANTVFPVEYRGKKWIAWLPGTLYLKAAVATDGSVLTMESMIETEPESRLKYYQYKDERLCDAKSSPKYINKEKTLAIPRRELIAYAKLKCKALGIAP